MDRHDSYNDVMNIIVFENGTNALIDGSLGMTPGYPFTMHMRVLGTIGTLEFSYKAGENLDAENCQTYLKLYLEGEGGRDVVFKQGDAYGSEIQYFADCIMQGKDPEIVSEKSVLTVLKSILKAKESLTTGEVYQL
jgi:predicted dehydrogenase